MNKNDLYVSMHKKNIYLDGFELISKDEYEKALSDREDNVYKSSDDEPFYFKTNGPTELTKLELQFRTYKSINLIKNIIVAIIMLSILSAIIVALILTK